MRYGWADHRGLSGPRLYQPDWCRKSLGTRYYHSDLNLIVKMDRERRTHITMPNGLLNATSIVAAGIRPYVRDRHTASVLLIEEHIIRAF
jgi:hypothetical protein